MKVFIVFEDTGDYYCESGHIKGVYDSEEAAEIRQRKLEELRSMRESTLSGYEWHIGEYEIGKEYDE